MPREVCEVAVTREVHGEPTAVPIGTFVLEDGKLSVQGDTDTLRAMMDVTACVPLENSFVEVTPAEYPVLWFHYLPHTFHGTYLSARMVT
jgi:hypothetical protein